MLSAGRTAGKGRSSEPGLSPEPRAEAVANASRHSNASHCVVKVVRENGHALVEVKDDGVGGADPKDGRGLRVLADRLSAHDAVLELVSAPGEGTIVYAEIPCA